MCADIFRQLWFERIFDLALAPISLDLFLLMVVVSVWGRIISALSSTYLSSEYFNFIGPLVEYEATSACR